MRRLQPHRALLVVVAAVAIVATACGPSDSDGATGATATHPAEIAPSFSVPTVDGEFSLSDHMVNDGRPIFLNLWASWCFPCREEMPAISRSSQRHTEIAFIGVAVQDSRADAEAFANEIGVEYLIAFDDDNAVDNAYKPLGLPASYIISSDGVILERIFGTVTENELDRKFAEHFG